MNKRLTGLYIFLFLFSFFVVPSGAQTTSTDQPATPGIVTPQEASQRESMKNEGQAHQQALEKMTETQAETSKAQREASEAMKESSRALKQQSSQVTTGQQSQEKTSEQMQGQVQPGQPQRPVMASDLPVRGPIRLSKLMNATVLNNLGDNLGTIEDVITDEKGKLDYVILSHGGLLGIGEKLIPIPIQIVQSGNKEKTVTVNIAKSALEKAPSFDTKNWPNFNQPEWRQKTYTYYDVYGGSPLDKGLSETQ